MIKNCSSPEIYLWQNKNQWPPLSFLLQINLWAGEVEICRLHADRWDNSSLHHIQQEDLKYCRFHMINPHVLQCSKEALAILTRVIPWTLIPMLIGCTTCSVYPLSALGGSLFSNRSWDLHQSPDTAACSLNTARRGSRCGIDGEIERKDWCACKR